MKTFSKLALIGAFAALAAFAAPRSGEAAFVTPAVTAGTSTAAGVGFVGTFIGIVTALDIYDFARRSSCLGDPLGLGGPGFTSAIKPTDNVLPPPRCPHR